MTEDRVEAAAAALKKRFRDVAGPDVTMPADTIWLSYAETALAAADAVTASGWQPIATAPKDGRILVFGGRFTEPDCVWSDGDWWRYCIKRGDLLTSLPTHWMPLPSPPAAHLSAQKESGG